MEWNSVEVNEHDNESLNKVFSFGRESSFG